METRRHTSVFWPLMLIIVGIVLILVNLGTLQGDSITVLINLWPLLFIIGGLDSIVRGEGYGGAVVTIVLGVALLLGNFGVLPLTGIELIFRLWPVFLVALGIDLVFRGAPAWSALLGGLVALAVIAGIFFLSVGGAIAAQPDQVMDISQPLENASEAEVLIETSAGSLNITPMEAGDQLVQGNVGMQDGQNLDKNFSVSNNRASYTLSSTGTFTIPVGFVRNTLGWELQLNKEVEIDLKTKLGAGEQVIDLSSTQVRDFSAELGVGEVDLTVPAGGSFSGSIENGIGSTVVRVPRDAEVEIRVDTGITGVQFPEGFTREDDVILSAGAQPGAADIVLNLDQAIGSIRIEYAR